MAEPYRPKAPTAPGTDDYRCFVLDPQLSEPAFVTGLDVLPGREDLVHHVIMFRIGPDAVASAKARDADTRGPGWTCFGGPGVDVRGNDGVRYPPWMGAWAPGSGETILPDDIGIPLEPGSRVIMQVHYNLLAGHGSDTSSARLRIAPGTADLDPLRMLRLPAPVELACRPGKTGSMCHRGAAVRDVATRFGEHAEDTVDRLQDTCGRDPDHPKASPVQTCDRKIHERSTVRAVAGHMHLLGRSISMTLNPGTARERVVLDIPVWNFDDQRMWTVTKPVTMEPGDVLRVRCRHDQELRDMLPALQDAPERYVVWGEGTTDEMCLGSALYTREAEK